MKSKIYTISVVLIIILISGLNNLFAQWPQWRGVNRDGICTEENLLKEWPANGPKRLWVANFVGDGWSSTAIENNVAYTVGRMDSVECVTAVDMDGNMLWQTNYGVAHKGDFPSSRCTPTFYKDHVYAFSGGGDFACLDSKTGAIKWKFSGKDRFSAKGNPVYQFCESPLVVDDKVILTTAGSKTTIVALNYLTGESVWESETLNDTCDYVSPVLIECADKKFIFASTQRVFFTADLSTGKIIHKVNNLVGIIPTVVNKTSIYCNEGRRGKLITYNQTKNVFDFAWCDSIPGSYMGGAVVVGDKIIGTSRNPNYGIHAININTGKLAFASKTVRESSVIATKDRIYAYDQSNGKVYLVKVTENSFEVVGSFRVTIGSGEYLAHLSIANGILYIRHGKALIAYDIKQS